jgi:hypothetical protein
MNAPFAARLPFEMLYGIRYLNLFAIDARIFERAIHNFTGRADKRFASQVLLISGSMRAPFQEVDC